MEQNESTKEAPPSGARRILIKFEFNRKPFELNNLHSKSSVAELRKAVTDKIAQLDSSKIVIKLLHPTRVLEPATDSNLLEGIFNQSREKIVVELSEERLPGRRSGPDSENYQGTLSNKHHKLDNDDNTARGSSSSSSASNSRATSLSSTNTRPHPGPNRDQDDQMPVCSSTGYLLRHPVPSNNSCLFISVHFCMTNGLVDDQIGKSMRKIIADTVASDLVRYDDAFLGKSNAAYCQWILDDNNWGGAIELSILCKYYKTEIVAIDVKNQILNRFGEDSHYAQRMLLLYDGIHYDPLKFQPFDENKPIQTLFPSENTEVLTLAEEVAKELNQSHQYTDLKTMTMICSTCNVHLDSKNLQEHAEKTGHESFREIA